MGWNEIGVTIKGNIDFGNAKTELKEIVDGINGMKQSFVDMPNFTRVVDNSLEKTATVAENLEKAFDKLSDEKMSEETRSRYEQQASAAIEELNSMRSLRLGNTNFGVQMAHSWFGNLPDAIRKEFDSITPEISNIIRTRFSSLNAGGKRSGAKSIHDLMSGIMYSGGGGIKDKEILGVLAKHNVSADAAMDFDDYLKLLLPHVVPAQYLKEYQKQRYGTALPKSNFFERGNPLDFIPNSYKRSWGRAYQRADLTSEQAGMVLNQTQRDRFDRILGSDPIAVRAAVASGISRRDKRGVLETQEEISRAQWEDFRSALYDEMIARTAGKAKGRVEDPYAYVAGLDRKTLSGRLSQSSSGRAVLAMKAIEDMEAASAWGSATGNTYWRKNHTEPKRALDSYVVEKYSPFVQDQGYKDSKSVEINESQATRVLGQGKWKHNDDVSGTIRLVSLEGYDSENKKHSAELRELWRNGRTFNGVPFVVDTVHSGKDGPVIRMIAKNARDEANARVAQWATPAGFTGSYFGNFSDAVIQDIVENGADPSRLTAKMYGKHFESLNKKWSPSSDLGLNTEGIKIAVIDTKGTLGGKEIEFGDGAMWASQEVVKDSFQTRIGAAGKGSVFTFGGKNLGAAFEKWGLLDEQGRAMVKGPNGEYYDASSANVMLPLSMIKNQMAYMKKNDDGTYTFRSSDEINRMAEAEVRNLGWGEMTNYEKDSRRSDNIGVQQMSFLNFSPETRAHQIELALKRMRELETETGQLKHVFGNQDDWFSQQVSQNTQLLGTSQAKAWVDNYKTRMIQDIISGTFFDFGEDDSKFSNVVAAANPLSAILQSMYGGKTAGMIGRAREIFKQAGITDEFTDQDIEDMIMLKPGNVVDFSHTSPEHKSLTLLRSPSGYGNILKATNLAATQGDAIRALYEGFGINTTAGTYMSEADRDILQGIDFDSDHFKIIYDPVLVKEIEDLTNNQVFSKQGLEKTVAETGDLKDIVEQGAQISERTLSQTQGMGFGSAGTRGMMLDLSNPVIAAKYVPGMQVMQAIYDAASTHAKDPVAYTTPQEAWDVIKLQKEYTKFTDHADELFRYDDDMYLRDEKGIPTKELDYNNPDLFRTTINGKEGPAVNMRALRAMGVDEINAPSVNMANQVMGLAFANMLYRNGMSDTTRWDAISQAMDALEYGTEGPARQELMSAMRHMLPEWASGKRGRLTEAEEDSISGMIANAKAELENEANQNYSSEQKGYVSPSGRVYKDVESYVENEGRKYSINTASQMIDMFGFTSRFGKAKLGDSFFDSMFENTGTIDVVSEANRTYLDQKSKLVAQLEQAKKELEKETESTTQQTESTTKDQHGNKSVKKNEGPRFGPGSTDQSYKGYAGENKPEVAPGEKSATEQNTISQTDAEKRVAELEQKLKDLDAAQAHRVEAQTKYQQLMSDARDASEQLLVSALGNENKVKGVSKAHSYWNKQFYGTAKPILEALEQEATDINSDEILTDKEKQAAIKGIQNRRSDLYRNLTRDFVSKAIAYTKQISDSITDAIDDTEDKSKQKTKLDEIDEGIKESKGFEEEIRKKMRLGRGHFSQEEQDMYASGLQAVREKIAKQQVDRQRLVDKYTDENELNATLAMEELEGRLGYRDKNSLDAQIQGRRDLIQNRRDAITKNYQENLMSKSFYDEQMSKLDQYDDNVILDVVNENKKALGLGGKTPQQKANEWEQKRLNLSSELMEAASHAYEIIDSQESPEAVDKAVQDLQTIQEIFNNLPSDKTIGEQAKELEERLTRQEKNIKTEYEELISGKRPSAATRASRNTQALKDHIADRIMEVGADSSLGKELRSILDETDWDAYEKRSRDQAEHEDRQRKLSTNMQQRQIVAKLEGRSMSQQERINQQYDSMYKAREEEAIRIEQEQGKYAADLYRSQHSAGNMMAIAQRDVMQSDAQKQLALEMQQRQSEAEFEGRGLSKEERIEQRRDRMIQERNKIASDMRAQGLDSNSYLLSHTNDQLENTAKREEEAAAMQTTRQRAAQLEQIQLQNQLSLEQQMHQYQQQNRGLWGQSRSRFSNAYLRQADMRWGLRQTIARNERMASITKDNISAQERAFQEKYHMSSQAYKASGGTDEKALADVNKIEQAQEALKNYNETAAQAQQQMEHFSKPAMAMRAGFTAISDSMTMLLKRFGRQMFMKAINEAKQFVKQYDKTMTEIQMITLKSDSEMGQVSDSIIGKAKELKVSIGEVSQSAATLYRQGLSDQEVDDRLGIISKFSKVSGTKVADATKLITVAMNTGLITDAMEASDIVTALGDNAATNAQQIEKGIEKAGAAAAADGTTFGQLAAMLTAITSTTQIGGNVAGRTLNTIFGRMNKIGTNELIIDENGNKISGSAVSQLLKAQGVETYTNGKKRSSFDVLRDLSSKWEGISDAEQQQLASAIAGTRQYSNFAAIMQGMTEGKIDDYLDLIGESSGITDKKFDTYKKSLEASLTDLKNTFDSTINDLVDKGVFTDIVSGLKDMIAGIGTLVASAGGLNTLMLGLGGIAILMGFIRGGAPGALAATALVGGLGIAYGIGAAQSGRGNASVDKEKAFENINKSYSDFKDDINTVRTLKDKENLTNNEKEQLKNSLANISLDSTSGEFNSLMSAIDGAGSAALSASKSFDSYTESMIKEAEQRNEQNRLQKMMEVDYGSAARNESREKMDAAKGTVSFEDPYFNTLFGKPNANGEFWLTGEDIDWRVGLLGGYGLFGNENEALRSALAGVYEKTIASNDYNALINDRNLTDKEKEYIKNGRWDEYVKSRSKPSSGMMRYVNKYLENLYAATGGSSHDESYYDSLKNDISLFAPDLTSEQLDALTNQTFEKMFLNVSNGMEYADAYNNALFSLIGTKPSQKAIDENVKNALFKISPDLYYKMQSSTTKQPEAKAGSLETLFNNRVLSLSSKERGYKPQYEQLLSRANKYDNIDQFLATGSSDYQELIDSGADTKLIEIVGDLKNNGGKGRYSYSDLVSHLQNAVYGGSYAETGNKLLSTNSSLSSMQANLDLMKGSTGSESLYKRISADTGLDLEWIRNNYDDAVNEYRSLFEQRKNQYQQDVMSRVYSQYNLDSYNEENDVPYSVISKINKEYEKYGLSARRSQETGRLDFTFSDINPSDAYSDLRDYSPIFTNAQLADISNRVKGLTWDEAVSKIGKDTWSEEELNALQNYNPDLVRYMKLRPEQQASSEARKLLEAANNKIALDQIDTSTVGGVLNYQQLKYNQDNKAGLAANRIFESLSSVNPEGIQSLDDLSNVVNSGNVQDWKTLLENNEDLAKKISDAGIKFDETTGQFDLSGLTGGAEGAAAALQMLASAVAGASEAYSKQQEVLSTGEKYDLASKYLSGEYVNEEQGFSAYSEITGNANLAQVVRNARIQYDKDLERYNQDLAEYEMYQSMSSQEQRLYRHENGVPVYTGEEPVYAPYEELNEFERRYAEQIEQNIDNGVYGGLTDKQRDVMAGEILSMARTNPGQFKEMREGDKIGAMNDIFSGISDAPELLNDVANGGDKADRALKQLEQRFDQRHVSNMLKWKKGGDQAASMLNSLKNGGEDAARAMADMRKNATQINDAALAVKNARKASSGKALNNQTVSDLAGITGDDPSTIRKMTGDELDNYLDSVQSALDEKYETNFLNPIQAELQSLAESNPIKFQQVVTPEMIADGQLDTSEIAQIATELHDDALAKMAEAAGPIGTLAVNIMRNWMSVTGFLNFTESGGTATATGDGTHRGGGGGGGGGKKKSALDKLLEKQAEKIAKLQHKQNMAQIYENKYDYLNDYGGLDANYDEQLANEEALRKQHEKNIAKLKKQLKKTKDPEERKKIKEQIRKEEEEAAKNETNAYEIKKKKYLTSVDERQTNRQKPLEHERSILDILASRGQITGNYDLYAANTRANMAKIRDKQAMNNEDIEEWKRQLSQVEEGSDLWIEIRDKIYQKEEENAQLENDYLQKQNELIDERLNNVAKILNQRTQAAQHALNMNDIWGGYYQTAGYRQQYESSIRDKYAYYDTLIAENQVARDEALATAQAALAEGNTDKYHEAMQAVYGYDEAIAQATVDQLLLNEALNESKIEGIAEAFNDATMDLRHTDDLLKNVADDALERNDFGMYERATEMWISNEEKVLKAAEERRDNARKNLADLLNPYDKEGKKKSSDQMATPEDIRKAEQEVEEAENEVVNTQLSIGKANRELVKNRIDRMLNDQQWAQANYEHNQKLLGYQTSVYQNNGELTNYGLALTEDTRLRTNRVKVLEEEKASLYEMLKNVDKGSEEEKRITEEIRKHEEAIASENTQIDKNNKMLEENQKKIRQVQKTLEDSIDKEIEAQKKRNKEILNANVSMQNTLLDVLKKRMQEEWALEKKDLEKEKESLNEYKKLISERFNYRKKASQQADKDEQLADYRRQLALIEADPTRSKDAKELRKKIEDLEKERSWAISEDEVAAENERIDNQIQGIDKYVQYREESLNELLSDANNFADELNALIDGSFETSYKKILDFMERENKAFIRSLPDAAQQMLNSWEETWKKAKDVIDSNYSDIINILDIYEKDEEGKYKIDEETGEKILKSYTELSKPEYLNNYLQAMKDRDVEYRKARESNDENTMKILERNWTDNYKNFLNSIKNDFSFEEDTHILNDADTKIEELMNNEFTVKGVDELIKIAEQNKTNAKIEEEQEKLRQKQEEEERLRKEEEDAAPHIGNRIQPTVDTPFVPENPPQQTPPEGIDLSDFAYQPGDKEQPIISQLGGGEFTPENTDGKITDTSASSLPMNDSNIVSTTYTYYNDTQHKRKDKYKNGQVRETIEPHVYNSIGKCIRCGHMRIFPGGTNHEETRAFASGGLVDYTGIAWVDGTKAKPEAFLSAADTENIRAMLDMFGYISVAPLTRVDNSAYGNTTNIGDINITINQAEISSDYDVEKLAKQVGQAFTKELKRNGINTAGYAF